MKRYILAYMSALFCTSLFAQTLNVEVDGLIYSYPAAETGIMQYSDGKTLNIAGHVYNLGDVDRVFISEDDGENNLVKVVYKESSADVYISYDIIPYIDAKINGANVEITQSSDVSDSTCGEITYRLSGASNDGSFLLNGSYKCSLELTGLNLKSMRGAAIDIENGKRIAVRVAENTENYLEDGTEGDQKACLYTKGHLEFRQKGSLTVKGNTGHAIAAKEYVDIKNTKLTVTGAVKDGINCTQYFLMQSGTLTISGTGDDGVQLDYKDSENRDDEDTGTITIEGGNINISVTNDASKALKAEGDFIIKDGTVNASVTGNGIWDSSKSKTKASSCIGADENVYIEGGELTLNASGSGGKGISADGDFLASGGKITILTTGGLLAYVNGSLQHNYTGNTDRLDSDYKSSPKGIKIDGNITITDGYFNITCTGKGGEGIESKSVLTIDGGDIVVRAYDDGTNSSSDTNLNGGNLDVMSIGEGDGVDSNGNIYVNGGKMMIFGTRQPEQGFDAGDGYSIYFNGGEFLAYGGGGNSVPSNSSQSTQAYLGLSQTVKAGETVIVKKDGTELVSFSVPSDYGTYDIEGVFGDMPPGGFRMPPFMAPPGGGGGFGGRGAELVISCPGLINGTAYEVVIGSSATTATAKTTN